MELSYGRIELFGDGALAVWKDQVRGLVHGKGIKDIARLQEKFLRRWYLGFYDENERLTHVEGGGNVVDLGRHRVRSASWWRLASRALRLE